MNLASVWGVTSAKVRKQAKGLRITVQNRRGYITLPKDDIEALRSGLRPEQAGDTCSLPNHPGLPLEALSEPGMRELLHAYGSYARTGCAR